MSIGGFLVSWLTAEVNIKNLQVLVGFLRDRLNSKPIKLSIKTSDGKILEVQASSQRELEEVIQAAQRFLETPDSNQNETLSRLEEKGKQYLRHLEIAQRFLEQAGAKVADRNERSLYIVTIPENLRLLPPISVLITTGEPTKEDIAELVQKSRQLTKAGFERAGILLYEEPPNTVIRMRIAEARLDETFMIVPIPLAEVETALSSNRLCEAVLTKYIDRYIQRADFFDDKNAISDTVSFFGRSDLLNRLKEELLSYQGIGIFGLRKSGKTSILYQLSFLLRKHPVVRIDLQQYAGSYYGADLFNDILRQLSVSVKAVTPEYDLGFDGFVSGTAATELTVKFIEQVFILTEALQERKYELPILCFLDEVERILPTPQHPKEKVEEFNACLGTLRALCQDHRKLALLVADVHPDCNRINYWTQEGVSTNPVFSFFKEIFLPPFSEQDTVEMLVSIGEFMGLKFDDKTPVEIHRESGGHPFVSRQISRFLSKMLPTDKSRFFEWSALQPNMDNLLFDFDELSNFFEKSIWEDLEKRGFESAISVLKCLSCNSDLDKWINHQDLLMKLSNKFTGDQCRKALTWLVSVGIIDKKQGSGSIEYQIRMLQLSRWICMQMTGEELQQWKLD